MSSTPPPPHPGGLVNSVLFHSQPSGPLILRYPLTFDLGRSLRFLMLQYYTIWHLASPSTNPNSDLLYACSLFDNKNIFCIRTVFASKFSPSPHPAPPIPLPLLQPLPCAYQFFSEMFATRCKQNQNILTRLSIIVIFCLVIKCFTFAWNISRFLIEGEKRSLRGRRLHTPRKTKRPGTPEGDASRPHRSIMAFCCYITPPLHLNTFL